jgi:23S rRNA (cytidine1920-2'-O)/16S rRNA (cytidine1409-2'-O)-methyltransferase
MKHKERLDNLLVERQLFASREAARTAIMDGAIIVNGEKVTKAGAATSVEAEIQIVKSYNLCPYVSRGGLKLEKALAHFEIDVTNRVAIDGGASTGGFTDCLLQKGAAFVYAVDVGHGQLDWKIRSDERVKVLEKVNLRHLKAVELYSTPEGVTQKEADLAVMDVSFISVIKVLPALFDLLSAQSHELVVLIKPQFEAGKDKIGKGGVVRDKQTHYQVLDEVISFVASTNRSVALTYSPIKGPAGNIEYLLHITGGTKSNETAPHESAAQSPIFKSVVDQAFEDLGAP